MGPNDQYGSYGQYGQYGSMGHEQGMGGYPPASGSGKANKPLLVAVSALVTMAVLSVGLVLWPGDAEKEASPVATASPTTSKNTPVAKKEPITAARRQAGKVNALLDNSADTRRDLVGALVRANKCQSLPAAINGFKKVAQQRQNQMRRTKALKVDKLKNGRRMRVTLYQAFKTSLEADQRLLNWADKAKRNCRGKPRPDVRKAPGRRPAERKATIAKKKFVKLWNPVADAAGLPQRKWNGF